LRFKHCLTSPIGAGAGIAIRGLLIALAQVDWQRPFGSPKGQDHCKPE
jgi:hypothetical protein